MFDHQQTGSGSDDSSPFLFWITVGCIVACINLGAGSSIWQILLNFLGLDSIRITRMSDSLNASNLEF
jgi:hypothetical protein